MSVSCLSVVLLLASFSSVSCISSSHFMVCCLVTSRVGSGVAQAQMHAAAMIVIVVLIGSLLFRLGLCRPAADCRGSVLSSSRRALGFAGCLAALLALGGRRALRFRVFRE